MGDTYHLTKENSDSEWRLNPSVTIDTPIYDVINAIKQKMGNHRPKCGEIKITFTPQKKITCNPDVKISYSCNDDDNSIQQFDRSNNKNIDQQIKTIEQQIKKQLENDKKNKKAEIDVNGNDDQIKNEIETILKQRSEKLKIFQKINVEITINKCPPKIEKLIPPQQLPKDCTYEALVKVKFTGPCNNTDKNFLNGLYIKAVAATETNIYNKKFNNDYKFTSAVQIHESDTNYKGRINTDTGHSFGTANTKPKRRLSGSINKIKARARRASNRLKKYVSRKRTGKKH